MDGGRGGQRVGRQRLADRLGDGLRPRERLHVHGVDVQNVARWRERERGCVKQGADRRKQRACRVMEVMEVAVKGFSCTAQLH